jgi:uncharacterized membrane protein
MEKKKTKKINDINFDNQRMIFLLEQINTHLYHMEEREKSTAWMDKLHAFRGIIVVILLIFVVYKMLEAGQLNYAEVMKHLLTMLN